MQKIIITFLLFFLLFFLFIRVVRAYQCANWICNDWPSYSCWCEDEETVECGPGYYACNNNENCCEVGPVECPCGTKPSGACESCCVPEATTCDAC